MKKLSSILALVALFGFASSALAHDDKDTSTTSTQNQPAATSQEENKDKAGKAASENSKEATKEDNHADED